MGIRTNSASRTLEINQEILIRKYITERKSMCQTAKELGCSARAIRNHLHIHNIQIRGIPEYHIGSRRTEDTKYKCSISKIGSKNPAWKGGISNIYQIIRSSSQYVKWRRAVLVRDNYACLECGRRDDLEAHHIKPFATHPELRFEVDNGETLCYYCHRKVKI
jgi:hypothetical protein